MFEINLPVALATVSALVLAAYLSYRLVRHLLKESAHERALASASYSLDRLAMTLSYARLAAENGTVSRKNLQALSLARRDFRLLVKRRNLYCEQGASLEEWLTLSQEAGERIAVLSKISDLARDEIYWAKMARRAHKEAQRAILRVKAAKSNKAELTLARIKILAARANLQNRHYLEAWEEAKTVQELIELGNEKTRLSCLLEHIDCNSASERRSDKLKLIEEAREVLESPEENADRSKLQSKSQQLRLTRIKLESSAESLD